MPFTLETWKEQTAARLSGWKTRLERASVNSVYYFIAASALLPLIQAAAGGDWGALVTLGSALSGAVGTNLLANLVQNAKDKTPSDAQLAQILQAGARAKPELGPAIDTLIEKLDAIPLAERALPEADRRWFREIIQQELAQLHSGVHYTASLTGDGAIAQGDHPVAIGVGGLYVNGDYHAPDPQQTERERAEAARRSYLDRLRRHCQALPLATLGGEEGCDDDLTLDDVYVDLNTDRTLLKTDLEKLRQGQKIDLSQANRLPQSDEERKNSVPLPAWDAVLATPRVVLLGDPGAGKSTFARKLVGIQAAVQLEQ